MPEEPKVSRRVGKAAVLRTAPAYSFGQKHKQWLDNGVPGPGTYSAHEPIVQHHAGHSILSVSRSLAAYTFAGKPNPARPPMQPGPSDYNPREDVLRRSAAAFTLHGSEQKDSRRKYPGPGHYPTEQVFTVVRPHQPAISISNRYPESAGRDQKPGPGAYPASDYRVKENPGVSLKFRRKMGSVHETPAPHDYADKDFVSFYSPKNKAKGITFGIRHKVYEQEAFPGPKYQVGCSTLGIAASVPVPKSQLAMSVVL